MQDVTTAIARVIAMENGAGLTVIPGVAFDPTDAALSVMADALLKKVEGTGIDLLSLHRDGATLTAYINDDLADEPLCPAAFGRVVRQLSHMLLGEVWDGRLIVEYAPTPAPAPAQKLVRVA